MSDFIGKYIVNNPVFWISLVLIVLLIIFFKEIKSNTFIKKALRRLPKKDYIVLDKLNISSSRKSFVIDNVIISIYGIFVIKYVNLPGKIYGEDREMEWIALKDRKKTYFENPSKELHSQIRVLAKVLDLNEKFFIPIICFTEEVTMSIDTKDKVTELDFLDDTIKSYKNKIIRYGLFEIKDKLLNSTCDDSDEVVENSKVCPNCGAKLVVRNGKYGDFIGCSNYPKCKYTKEI